MKPWSKHQVKSPVAHYIGDWAGPRANHGDSEKRKLMCVNFFSLGVIAPYWTLASSFTRFVFLDHTQRHTTVGRTPLDE